MQTQSLKTEVIKEKYRTTIIYRDEKDIVIKTEILDFPEPEKQQSTRAPDDTPTPAFTDSSPVTRLDELPRKLHDIFAELFVFNPVLDNVILTTPSNVTDTKLSPSILPLSMRKTLKVIDKIAVRYPEYLERSISILGLNEQIRKLEEGNVARFFDPANLERVARRENYPDFVQKFQEMLRDPATFSEREKLRMLQFVSNAYNDHIGAPRITVKFFDGESNHHGLYENGGNSVQLNRRSLKLYNNFAAMVGTLIHENTHNAQYNPNVYANPILSRVYRANFQAYKNPQMHGYEAYKSQPIEQGAFAAGEMAETLAKKLAADNDNFRPSPRMGRRAIMELNAA